MLNIIVLILYRTGYGGDFLGVGGTWNLNEEKNADAEIVASGVFVGFMIYTSVQLVTFCFGTTAHKRYNNIIRLAFGQFFFLLLSNTEILYV